MIDYLSHGCVCVCVCGFHLVFDRKSDIHKSIVDQAKPPTKPTQTQIKCLEEKNGRRAQNNEKNIRARNTWHDYTVNGLLLLAMKCSECMFFFFVNLANHF